MNMNEQNEPPIQNTSVMCSTNKSWGKNTQTHTHTQCCLYDTRYI